MTRKAIISVPLFFVIITVGCAGGTRVPDSPAKLGNIESSQELKEINTNIITQGGSTGSPADYLIGPADLLEIKVFESEKLTSLVRVSSRGQITLPLLENVDVNDLTAREAEIKIENLLKEGRYINNPHVSVFVKEYKSKLVSVVGYVQSPGSYELVGRQTVLEVLAAAKGLTDRAGRTVYLTRNEENGKRQAYVLYLDDLLLKTDSEANLRLKPGDVVYVPEAGSVFVEGAVVRTGAFPIKEGFTTVSQSIAMAGGLASFANKGDVKLVSYLGNGKREVKQVDLGKIRNGEGEDPLVKDRDAVVVGVSIAKRIITGLHLTYLWGLLGVGYAPSTPIVYGSGQ